MKNADGEKASSTRDAVAEAGERAMIDATRCVLFGIDRYKDVAEIIFCAEIAALAKHAAVVCGASPSEFQALVDMRKASLAIEHEAYEAKKS